jgi:tol-pal system protein YbgF
MVRRFVLLLLLVVSATGAASAGLFTDDAAQGKIARLQQQVLQLQQQVQDIQGRLAKLENSQGKGLVDLLAQVESLQADVAKLRGRLEVQTHDIGANQKRQKDFYVDLDTRLRRLEKLGAGAAVAAPGPVTAAQPAPADPAEEARGYAAVLNMFKIGNYQAAIAGFQDFIKRYPGSKLAPSAQYWIGNSYFALRDFKTAIANQQKLISLYPSSRKVPDAMLNMASCQLEMGDTDAARKTLEQLVAKYPISSAAELAQKRLGRIK